MTLDYAMPLNPEKPAIPPIVGRRAVLRDGTVTTTVVATGSSTFPFIAKVGRPACLWLASGRRFRGTRIYGDFPDDVVATLPAIDPLTGAPLCEG